MAKVYYALYTSLLSPDSDPHCVREIVRFARSRNAQLNVTGVLVFDGFRFCQYLEGPSETILTLCEKIRNDSRHDRMDIKEHGRSPGARRFADWSMAYALSNDTEGLNQLHQFNAAEGGSAIALLEHLLPKLDMEPNFVR
jgi:hypothetical protein